MDSHYSVKLGQLIKDFELEVLRGAPGFEDILIQKEDVNRPALQLAGFFDYFDNKRIQMIGRVEATYLAQLSAEERRISFDQLLARDIPCLIITRAWTPSRSAWSWQSATTAPSCVRKRQRRPLWAP